MLDPTDAEKAIIKLCQATIADRFGDISDLPVDVQKYVLQTYYEFLSMYVSILQQKESRPTGWVPETVTIDSNIVDDLRYFISDYEHITKNYLALNKKVDLLRMLNKETQPNLFQHHVQDILQPGTLGNL
jgi:hypothetical protein